MGVLPERTERFEAFVAPARAAPQLWRLALGIVLAALVWLATAFVVLGLGSLPRPENAARAAILLFLLSFAGLVLGVWLAARLVQRRRPARLLGPDGFRPRDFGLGVAVVAAVGCLSLLPMLLTAPPVRNLPAATWLGWLPLALPALLVQTSAEEIAFRGYLMQSLAARFRWRPVWLLLPALLFGLMHWNPAEFGPNAWLAVASAAAIGLVLGDVTARSGNLSLAMGIHFANNVSALLLVSLPSPFAALALFVASVDPTDAAAMRRLLILDVGSTLALYGLWLAACARWRRLHSWGPGSI
jgi:uncharacterized protein